jgi:hypothetical protein
MRRAALLALAAMLGACATRAPAPVAPARPPYQGPTHTRASVANLSTAELAALFLDPADAARAERHSIGGALNASHPLRYIDFVARDRPLAPDICGRDFLYVNLILANPSDSGRTDPPVRPEAVQRRTGIALAPGCEDLPGRRFASVGRRHAGAGPRLTREDGIRILRALAAARAAAAGPGPLPFRLRCGVDGEYSPHHPCPADLRALLAGLPLHRTLSIDRPPFIARMLCGPMPPATGDSVEIDAELEGGNDGYVWEVRLRDLGTDRADITFNRAPRWDNVAC